MDKLELEREQQYDDDEDDDGSYANAYLNDDDENEDDDGEDDDLAAMFAKVKTIQQTEGIQPSCSVVTATTTAQAKAKAAPPPPSLDVKIIQATTAQKALNSSRASGSTPTSARRSKSPSSGSGVISEDGIKTISRRTLGSSGVPGGSSGKGPVVRIDALLNVKKPAIYEDKILQSIKSSDLLEKLKMKTTQAAPEPAKKSSGRKFATDDEERHCRFKPKKGPGVKKESSDYDNNDGGSSATDRRSDFIARMEAAEKCKQKKLEMTRGENDYNTRLDKKCCPKCTMAQSYSEWKDKKKRCQMCGVEFRVLQAWGDVGADFIARMSDATQAKSDKQEQIRALVTQLETSGAMRVKKTAKQQFYEKQMLQKSSHNSFLDRNYHNQSNNGVSSSKAKQFQVQMQIQTQRAKLLASSCESPVV